MLYPEPDLLTIPEHMLSPFLDVLDLLSGDIFQFSLLCFVNCTCACDFFSRSFFVMAFSVYFRLMLLDASLVCFSCILGSDLYRNVICCMYKNYMGVGQCLLVEKADVLLQTTENPSQ